MHRAFQRLDQFVSFNLIAAPVAFQKSADYSRGVQLLEHQGDAICFRHRISPPSKNEKGLPEAASLLAAQWKDFSPF